MSIEKTFKLNDRPRSAKPISRKPYTTPLLECFGDVRSLTLGGSPGTNDSGNPGTECRRGQQC